MFNKNLLLIASIASISFLSGCATLADAKAAKGTGVAKEYAAPLDSVWNSIPAILTELKLPLVNQNKQEGEILAQAGISMVSYGENVAILWIR
ncbi:MAG: hypothetical protein WCD07_03150 [Burkholderiales bacterium]